MKRVTVAFDRRRFVGALGGLVGVFLVVVATGGGAAADGQDDAKQSVWRLVDQIVELLSDDGIDQGEGYDELARVIDQEADLELLGRLVLGRHWRTISDDERQEYQDLFRQLMLRKFAGYLRSYTGDELGATEEVFEITGARRVNQRDIVVTSVVRPPNREPLEVKWRLRGQDDPAIIDVVVENVSLLISQRSEFATVIERRGIDGLLAELRARVKDAVPVQS